MIATGEARGLHDLTVTMELTEEQVWIKTLKITTNFGPGLRLVIYGHAFRIETLTPCCGSSVIALPSLRPHDLGCDECGSDFIEGYYFAVDSYERDLNHEDLENSLRLMARGQVDPLLAVVGVQALMETVKPLLHQRTLWASHDATTLLETSL